jgi:Uma2 family endonuclease
MILLEDSIRIPPRATDFDEFRKWTTSHGFPDTGRIDFLAGSIDIDMSPEELHTHGVVKTAISAKLHEWIVEGDLGEVFSDRTRVVSPEVELSVEPDVVVVLWPSLVSGRVRYVPSRTNPDRSYEMEGAPDLIVEIVSDSSVSKDTRRLPRLYASAGVP